ncbi:hypothetical protein Q5424_02745 [Conexibacter sp. JD483]|uniref:hypothetical protein n=1 Tax=unclassified Conexibacter TaxID=2627773 RepID=UPI0027196216|nr:MULTISPECIES: hypothetical protein [unclassified Conexibacter]MDO8184073.1 hypothetical protein [Conexibacter sp. CPCC 205706]MDO8197065.1 hypothetical protein [Conexibacter sp. CPCC 205762]MDR9367981.1 hypothetical protein [Conexibacter sp. JD483]
MPYTAPAERELLRLAFVGQGTYFEACAQMRDGAGLQTRFVEFREGAELGRLLGELHTWRPHVVLVFRPEIVPAGAFAGLDAATLGFLTEPLPRARGSAHDDLEIRLKALRKVDRSNFDRIVAFDPHIVAAASEVLPVWRSLPLPVDDRFFADVEPIRDRPKVMFVGRSTGHREQLLTPSKHGFDVLHLAFGVDAERLDALMREHHVGINLHNEPYPSFENRVSLHLAAGHLVLSEPLDPLHGLEPGIDFVEVGTAGELHGRIELLQRSPDAYHRVRVRGRMKAEGFRASKVYPRLVHDLLLDLRAFGSERLGAR